MNIDEENKYAEVFMKADQVSLAIGKRGVNIKIGTGTYWLQHRCIP
jgi:N utilization substance protein A